MDRDKLQTESVLAAPSAGDSACPDRGLVDVVIVSADMHEMTLACVAELDHPEVAQIIVVDNASGEAPADISERFSDTVDIVRLEHRHGFAAANNRGLVRGVAPYVLLLNSDILAVPGSIKGLLEALEQNTGAVAAGGRLVDPDTLITQPAYRPRAFPQLASFAVMLLGVEEIWPGNPVTRRYHGSDLDDETMQTVQQPAAAALMVRRAVLEDVEGFDERFWFWFEDSDLLLRLSGHGTVLYVPTAIFRHLGGGTFRRWSKPERIRSVHHGILHYADAHFSYPRRAVLGLIVMAISAPRIVLFGRARPEEAQAWRDVVVGARALLRGRAVPPIASEA